MLTGCLPQMKICQGHSKPKLPKYVRKLSKLKYWGQSFFFWRFNKIGCTLTMLEVYKLQRHERFQAVQGGIQLHVILLFKRLWIIQKHRGCLVRKRRNVTPLTTGSTVSGALWPQVLHVPQSICSCTRYVGCRRLGVLHRWLVKMSWATRRWCACAVSQLVLNHVESCRWNQPGQGDSGLGRMIRTNDSTIWWCVWQLQGGSDMLI